MPATPGMPEFMDIGDRLKRLESQVDKLNRMTRLESATVGAGGITIDGGAISVLDASGNVIATFDVDGASIFEADGSTLIELDGTGLRLNDASGTKLIDLTTAGLQVYEADGSTLMVLDGARLRYNRADGTRSLEITPAGGLKFYATNGTTVITTIDSTGVQVGTDVVMDSTGLHVAGGDVQAVWAFTDRKFLNGVNVTGTESEVHAITIDPPDWVEVLFVSAWGRVKDANTSGGDYNLNNNVRIDDGGASQDDAQSSATMFNANSVAFTIPNSLTVPLSPAGRSVKVTHRLQRTTGSGTKNVNDVSLNVLAFGVRSAFS